MFQTEQALKVSKGLREKTKEVKRVLDEAKDKVREGMGDKKEWWQERTPSSDAGEGIISKMLTAAKSSSDKPDTKTENVKGILADTKKASKLIDRHLAIMDSTTQTLTKQTVDPTTIATRVAKSTGESVSPADVYSTVEKEITGDKLTDTEKAILNEVRSERGW